MEEPHKKNKTIFTGKALAALVIPLVLEQMLGITVGMADSIMVSSAGEAAVSGVSLVDSIAILLINAFASLSTGGAVVAAHRLGEKRKKKRSNAPTSCCFLLRELPLSSWPLPFCLTDGC